MEDDALLRLIGQYLTERKFTVTLQALERERYATRLTLLVLVYLFHGLNVMQCGLWYLQWNQVY